MPFQETTAGSQIYYLDENPAGRANVLLLHGLGANSNSWLLQIPALVDAGYRVLAPDAPGFGQSTFPGGSARISTTAARIIEWLDAIGVNSFFVVGISMGGTLALQLAINHPDRVTKLVLVNTFAKLEVANWRVFPYFLLRFILVHTLGIPTQARAVSKRIFPHPDQEFLRQELIRQISQADPKAYRATMRALAIFNVQNRLSEICCPTLVVTGEADNTVPLHNQQQLVQNIPGARQVLMPNAGHAVTVEQPESFNQIMMDFLLSR